MEWHTIEKILVPVDGSEQSFAAASFAIKMASKFGSELRLLHVVAIDQNIRALGLYGKSYSDAVEKRISEVRKEVDGWFEKISTEAEKLGVSTKSEIIDTPLSVVGEIVDYVEKNGIGMIIMGTKGRSGFTRLLMGSVATGVITYSSCPVLIVR